MTVNTKKIKKFDDAGKCQTFSSVKQKKIDTRLDDYLFALVDAYAKRHGLKRTQVIIRSLEKFFGIEHADPAEFARHQLQSGPREKQTKDTPETILMQDAPGEICELPELGSLPAKPTRYQKGTGRKSSQ